MPSAQDLPTLLGILMTILSTDWTGPCSSGEIRRHPASGLLFVLAFSMMERVHVMRHLMLTPRGDVMLMQMLESVAECEDKLSHIDRNYKELTRKGKKFIKTWWNYGGNTFDRMWLIWSNPLQFARDCKELFTLYKYQGLSKLPNHCMGKVVDYLGYGSDGVGLLLNSCSEKALGKRVYSVLVEKEFVWRFTHVKLSGLDGYFRDDVSVDLSFMTSAIDCFGTDKVMTLMTAHLDDIFSRDDIFLYSAEYMYMFVNVFMRIIEAVNPSSSEKYFEFFSNPIVKTFLIETQNKFDSWDDEHDATDIYEKYLKLLRSPYASHFIYSESHSSVYLKPENFVRHLFDGYLSSLNDACAQFNNIIRELKKADKCQQQRLSAMTQSVLDLKTLLRLLSGLEPLDAVSVYGNKFYIRRHHSRTGKYMHGCHCWQCNVYSVFSECRAGNVIRASAVQRLQKTLSALTVVDRYREYQWDVTEQKYITTAEYANILRAKRSKIACEGTGSLFNQKPEKSRETLEDARSREETQRKEAHERVQREAEERRREKARRQREQLAQTATQYGGARGGAGGPAGGRGKKSKKKSNGRKGKRR